MATTMDSDRTMPMEEDESNDQTQWWHQSERGVMRLNGGKAYLWLGRNEGTDPYKPIIVVSISFSITSFPP